MQHWVDVGFTSAQAELLSQLVTKEYLDQRLGGFVTMEYLDQRLREEFARHKRSMLLWNLAMQAPVYATLIYLAMRLGL